MSLRCVKHNSSLLQLLPVLVLGVMYATRARTLARRGTPVPWWRIASFALSLVLLTAGTLMPLEDELFFMHMLQHVVIGDLAALAFVIGLTGPLLRPLLAFGQCPQMRRPSCLLISALSAS